jgi:hypothetical protein
MGMTMGMKARWRRARSGARWLGRACALAVLPGCIVGGAGQPEGPGRLSKPIVEFPSLGALAEIERMPAPPPDVPAGEIPAAGWSIDPQGAALRPDEPWQPSGPWDAAFAADASQARARLRLTKAMACVARETGRFLLETHAPPPDVLQQFQIAACGAIVPQVATRWISGEIPDRITEEQALGRWRSQLKTDLLADIAPDLPSDLPAQSAAQGTDAGFWFGRAHGHALALIVHAAPRARWKTLAFTPDAQGNVTLEGELTEAADYILGYANQGRFGVEKCTLDPGVARPHFRAICPIAKDDTTAWIQLLSAAPKRVLATPFAQILIRRSADQPLVFEAQTYGEAHPVSTPADFSKAIVEQLNAVRKQAGFQPVQLSPAESARAGRLAGHYFSDAFSPDRGPQADRVALGLLAGWQMEGLIRDGLFFARLAPRVRDAGQWLTQALIAPMGRATLLARDIDAISLGSVFLSQPDGLGAVVTGYRLYHGDDHSADVRQLYARLLAGRRRLGLKMPARLGGMDGVMRLALQRVQAGTSGSSQALQTVLDQGVTRFGAGMRGYVMETTSLDALQIPDEIISLPNLYFEIGVGHYRAPGAAWGQMVILVVFADERDRAGMQAI